MKVQQKLAEAETPDGGRLYLFEHDGNYSIRLNGQNLMSSNASASEMLLGELGTARLASINKARILIGGLGLGFTLKSVLDSVSSAVEVHVAELIPEVIAWNRNYLKDLNGALLEDERVTIHQDDVLSVVRRKGSPRYDAILLDIDNGPTAMVSAGNVRLYDDMGLSFLKSGLAPQGRAVFWSAQEDGNFLKRAKRAGFSVEAVRAKRYEQAKKNSIYLYVLDKPNS